MRVVVNSVEIAADFEIVAAMPLAGRKKQIGDCLPPAGMSVVVEVVASASRAGIEEVGKRPVGIEFRAVLDEGESGLEELASGEGVLVFGAGHVGGLNVFGI